MTTFYCSKCGRTDDDLGQCGGPPTLPCPEPLALNPNAVVHLFCATHGISRAFTALDIIRGKAGKSATCGESCVVAVILPDAPVDSAKVPAPLGDAPVEMAPDTVHLDPVTYQNLKDDARFLQELEAAGVDNWEGYSVAYRAAHPEEAALLTPEAGGPAPAPEAAPAEVAPKKAKTKAADQAPEAVVEAESN